MHRLGGGDQVDRSGVKTRLFRERHPVLHPRVGRGLRQLGGASVGPDHPVEVLCEAEGRLPIPAAAVPGQCPTLGQAREIKEQGVRVARSVGGVARGNRREVVAEARHH